MGFFKKIILKNLYKFIQPQIFKMFFNLIKNYFYKVKDLQFYLLFLKIN